MNIDLGHCLIPADGTLDQACLLRALHGLPPGRLPLQGACTQGGIVDDGDLGLSVLGSRGDPDRVTVRVGVFFDEVVGGCNCHDDPAASTAYAVLRVDIRRADGRARVTLASETDAGAE